MKKIGYAAAPGIFLMFLITGGAWVGLARLVPEGVPRAVLIVGFGLVFAGIFIWRLVSRLRVILGGTEHLVRHALIAALEIVLLLVAFGSVYQMIGIVDTTRSGSPTTHSFWLSLYYSVITFTTLGYGDFHPQGIGRILAGMQALIGYLVLGVVASTASTVLSPHSKAGYQESGGGEE